MYNPQQVSHGIYPTKPGTWERKRNGKGGHLTFQLDGLKILAIKEIYLEVKDPFVGQFLRSILIYIIECATFLKNGGLALPCLAQ